MPVTVTVTSVATVPPDLFDIHYWYFGLAVILIVTMFVDGLLVERFHVTVGSDFFIIGTLFGSFIGSLIALFFNVIPSIVPIADLGIMILYFVRFRG